MSEMRTLIIALIFTLIVTACAPLNEEQKKALNDFTTYNENIENYSYSQINTAYLSMGTNNNVEKGNNTIIRNCEIDRVNDKQHCTQITINTNKNNTEQQWIKGTKLYQFKNNKILTSQVDYHFDFLMSLQKQLKKGKFSILDIISIEDKEYYILDVEPAKKEAQKFIKLLFKVNINENIILTIEKGTGEVMTVKRTTGFESNEFVFNDFVKELQDTEETTRKIALYMSERADSDINSTKNVLNTSYKHINEYENVTNSAMKMQDIIIVNEINTVYVEDIPEQK